MKVLFSSFESPGFLYPAIGLATALRRRGHQVAFVTDRTAEPRLKQAGFERLPRGDRDGRSFETGQWFRPLAMVLQIKHLEHAMARFAPDLLVGQALALGPLIIRERYGIPVAMQGLATYLWPCGTQGPDAFGATARRRAWRHQTMLRHLNELRALAGLQPSEAAPEDSPLLADLFQLRSVRELHGGADLPPLARLVGACLWEPEIADDELPAWIAAARDAGRPIVYVHHGRACGGLAFWHSLVDGFADGSLRIAAAAGRLSAAQEAKLPAEAFFLRRQLPQSRVLSCADLMIGSAASSAVLGALSHGVPCLMIPSGGEQLDLAEQVERAGAGRILAPREVTPAALRRAAGQALADARLRHRARELQRAFARFAGCSAAAEDLEELVLPHAQARTSA